MTNNAVEPDDDELLMQMIIIKVNGINYQFFGPTLMGESDIDGLQEITFHTNLVSMSDVIDYLINMHNHQEQIRERVQ